HGSRHRARPLQGEPGDRRAGRHPAGRDSDREGPRADRVAGVSQNRGAEPEMPLNRSFLFAPGNVARRVEKALTLDADVAILDLEDSVAVSDKAATRKLVAEALARP